MIIFIKRHYFSSSFVFSILFFIQSFNSLILNSYRRIVESIQLNNGNFLIIIDDHIYIVDPTFTNITYQKAYCCFMCGYERNNKFAQFSKEDGGFIIIRRCDKIYIFSKDGYILQRIYLDLYLRSYIIPYGHNINNSFFYNIYSGNDNNIYFQKYAINSISNNINLIEAFSIELNYIYNNYITCQLMEYLNKNIISCFFQTNYNNTYFINLTFFDIENNFTIIKNISSEININSPLIYCLSTKMIEKGKQKILLWTN